MCRCVRRNAVLVLFNLHDLLAVRASVPLEVGGGLEGGRQETRAGVWGWLLGRLYLPLRSLLVFLSSFFLSTLADVERVERMNGV